MGHAVAHALITFNAMYCKRNCAPHACMQASFISLDALVARIRRDGELSALALDDAVLQQYKADSFLAASAAAAQAPGGEAEAAY